MDEYYEKYVAALETLFTRHKKQAGYTDERMLTILDSPEYIKKMKAAAKNDKETEAKND